MSSADEQVQRVLADSDTPADAAREEPIAPDAPPDRTRQFTHTSFSRMRASWREQDLAMLAELDDLADQFVRARFADAYRILARVTRLGRTRAADSQGEPLSHADGSPAWVTDEDGDPLEDWSQISPRDRSNLLHSIVVRQHEWGSTAAQAWLEAMVSKVQWEELFAAGFTGLPPGAVSGKPTIDDRTQWGHKNSIQQRYQAVFRSALSRRADSIVSAMERLYYLLDKHPGE